MKRTSNLRTLAHWCMAVVVVAGGTLLVEAAARERFVATAMSIATPGPTGAGMVEMVVERWSTDAERDQLTKALLEKGPETPGDTPENAACRLHPNTKQHRLRPSLRAEDADGRRR